MGCPGNDVVGFTPDGLSLAGNFVTTSFQSSAARVAGRQRQASMS
jgi:hypothetical protein